MSEERPNDELWRALLTGTHPALTRYRPIFRNLPSDPRCRLCNAPFRGFGAPLMRLITSKAGAGKIVVSEAAFHLSGLEFEHDRRELDLDGHSATVPVAVLNVSPESVQRAGR